MQLGIVALGAVDAGDLLGARMRVDHIFAQWLKIHVIPLAPLVTPLVATLAGAIALYSIHVTRATARRRAAIDFFLKTDMDKGMAEIFKAFRDSLTVWEVHAAAKKPIEDFIKGSDGKLSDDYRNINTYLSIHDDLLPCFPPVIS
jgi:hypothetical protein